MPVRGLETTSRTSSGSAASNVLPSNKVNFVHLGHLLRHPHLLHRLEVDVRPQHLLRHRGVIGGALDHAPAPELAEPPLAERRLRIVGVAIREGHVELVLLLAAVAVVVVAEQPLQDDLGRTVDVGRPSDHLRRLGAILELVEVHARQVQRLEHRLDRPGILRGEVLGERADLFRVIRPHLLRRDRGEADAVEDGAIVPRLADAEAVHLVDLHVRDHLRRRDGDQADVLVRMNASRRQPVPRPHRVGAGRKRHRERERLTGSFRLVGDRLERLRGPDAGLLQLVVEGDGLTVAVEQPRDDHRFDRRSGQAHRRGERHAEQHVRAVVFADRQLVANHRPRRFLRDDRCDPELLEVAELVRHHDRRAVGQRDDPEPHGLGLRRIVRVGGPGPPSRQSEHQAGGRRAGGVPQKRASFHRCRPRGGAAGLSPMNT